MARAAGHANREGRASVRLSSIVLLGLVMSLGSGACQRSSSAEDETSARRAAVEAATTAFHQALRTNDAHTFMSYVADDVVLMPPGESAVRGKDGVRAWYSAFLTQYRTSSLTLADREVLVANGFAIELGTFEWGLTPAAGGSPVVDRGNYIQVWKSLSDGQWRFAREVWNSSGPAK